MKQYAVDTYIRQFAKKGEDTYGDVVKVARLPESTIIVVSDGLGSGVKANILASLTVELACGLFGGELSLREIVESLIATLPICKWRNIAYSTFSIVRIFDTGQVTVAEYDSPSIIHVGGDKKVRQIEGTETELYEKTIRESHFRILPNEMLVLYSDGIVHAGVGEGLPMGWQEEGILDYVSGIAPKLRGDSMELANMVADQALEYWKYNPGDDGTVVCVKYRRARLANVITGPPAEKNAVRGMIREFLRTDGSKIICGGTTSHLIADFLGKGLEVDARYMDTDLPPPGIMAGADLVTEGILTLSRASEYLKRGIPDGRADAATLLLGHLLDADGIRFMVGTARNPAHQNTGLPDSVFLRRTIVEDLAAHLRARSKEVELTYY